MTTATRRYLILGGSGYIGRHLYARLGPEKALATWHRRAFPGGVHFDPETMHLADLVRGRGPFSHAFVLFGMARLLDCARDKTVSYRVNVTHMQRCLDQLHALGIRPVFSSSDVVFDGTRGNYREEDSVNPLVTYGRQKVAVEQYVLGSGVSDGLVVRLSKVYGIEPGDGTLLTDWLAALTKDLPIQCAEDQYFCPVFVEDVVDGLLALTEQDCTGIYHLCGPERHSRRELLTLLREVYAARFGTAGKSPVTWCSIHDFNFPERWPLDISMDIGKIRRAIGWQPIPPEVVCRRFVTNL
ncbi:MAG: sugar nucleotide-binding protein [Magnetococcus sp. DMHC-1]|nr:sugar nucleotide-binding protein [Magnetococcales bacterium]